MGLGEALRQHAAEADALTSANAELANLLASVTAAKDQALADLAECQNIPPPPPPPPDPEPPPGGTWPAMPAIPAAPTSGVVFDSANRYTADKILGTGSTYIFTGTGSPTGNNIYPMTVATKDDVQLVFLPGTVLEGGGVRDLAFSASGMRVKIWDAHYRNFRGLNADGIPNVKGAGAVLLKDGWEMYNCWGEANRYMAARFSGPNALIHGGRLSGNHQYGHGGTGHNCRVWGVEIDGNGDGIGVVVDNDRGGSKMVHSDYFTEKWCQVHDNLWNGLWSDINNYGHEYAYNVLERNGGAGIQYEVSFAGKIHHNRLTGHWRKQGTNDQDPKKAAIQSSMSPDMEIYENDVEGFLYGISLFNQDHEQWRLGKMRTGRCLGVRNVKVHDNRLTATKGPNGETWIASLALDGPGSIPTDRSADQKCGQYEASDRKSVNRFWSNTVTVGDPGKYPGSPYILDGKSVTRSVFDTATAL